jgi:hypothetical protein
MASPVFGRVAPAIPTAVTSGPLFTSPRGLPCQTMTQTITIDRQEVHAAAVLCQQSNGTWRIVPTQSAGTPARSAEPTDIDQ